ncbi:hypothetical protein ACFQFC_24690 [Amorphoplanes digitatis]|uniref:Uncharacterized protein n=1 Tax=Actinoplanes digitatis TaxID=1868 RepID=A0A7W7MV40_9ACTN|nr:hypothetical protein [Actinoplanes digitatis]MBB4767420.1 hypothetical protein [Actinoplanes digitatis]GID98364.1 hypothetical protein Adi01nite_77760 [Actinoplanes digitatis]
MNIDSVGPAERALVRGSSFRTYIKTSDPRGIGDTALIGTGYPSSPITSFTEKTGKDGTQSVLWLSADTFGNPTYVKRTVIVDNTAPAVSIKKAPKNKAKVKKKFTGTATGSPRSSWWPPTPRRPTASP